MNLVSPLGYPTIVSCNYCNKCNTPWYRARIEGLFCVSLYRGRGQDSHCIRTLTCSQATVNTAHTMFDYLRLWLYEQQTGVNLHLLPLYPCLCFAEKVCYLYRYTITYQFKQWKQVLLDRTSLDISIKFIDQYALEHLLLCWETVAVSYAMDVVVKGYE